MAYHLAADALQSLSSKQAPADMAGGTKQVVGSVASKASKGSGDVEKELEAELGQSIQTLRQLCFPLEVLEFGIKPSLQNAQASVDDDRRHILNKIAGNPLEDEPATEHENYENVNRCLGGAFANACVRRLSRLWACVAATGLVWLAAPQVVVP